jgi:hypothetical protein
MVGHKVLESPAIEDVTVLHSIQKGDSNGSELFGQLLLLRRAFEESVMKDVKRLVAFWRRCCVECLIWWLF